MRELILAKHFAHPHVVQCFDWAVLTAGSEAVSDAAIVLAGAEEQAEHGVGDPLWRSHHRQPRRDMKFENGVPASDQLRGTDGRAGASSLKKDRESASLSAPASPSIPAFRGPDECVEETPWPAVPNKVLEVPDESRSLLGSQEGAEKPDGPHPSQETATSPADSAESEAGFGSPIKHKCRARLME